MNFIIVQNVFLLLVIYCCNKASNRIVTRSKELVLYSWIPLSPEVSRLSPYTHTRQHTRTSRSFCIFAVHRLHTPRKITLQTLFCTGYSSCNFIRVNSTLSVCLIACCLLIFVAFSIRVSLAPKCPFVCFAVGEKTWLANAVECLSVENMVNEYN